VNHSRTSCAVKYGTVVYKIGPGLLRVGWMDGIYLRLSLCEGFRVVMKAAASLSIVPGVGRHIIIHLIAAALSVIVHLAMLQ
jgi:hypothetical protein